MRLIDADKLLEHLETLYKDSVKDMPEEFCALYCMFSTIISQSPVAFDINNVIIKLSSKIEENIDIDSGMLLDNWVVDMNNDLIADCIQIVASELKQ